MKEALEHIGETLRSVDNRPGQTMRFSPTRDEQNVSQWRDLENVRYKEDGIREDLFIRGGSQQFEGIERPENIITNAAFKTSYEDVTKEFVVVTTSDDFLAVYDITDDNDHFLGGGFGFNSAKPAQVIVNGRFVYLFDYVTQVAHYIDLKNMEVHEWMGHHSPTIGSISSISGGDITEQNIMGFEEGGSAYVQISNQLKDDDPRPYTWINAKGVIPRGVYEYSYNSGKYLTLNGKELKDSELLIISSETEASIDGSGDDIDLVTVVLAPLENDDLDYRAEITSVELVGSDAGSGNYLEVDDPWNENNISTSNTSTGNDYIFLPPGSDIDEITESNPSYTYDDYTVNEESSYEIPTIYRSYIAVFELDDGSFSLPSTPETFQVSADNIFDNNGELSVFGTTVSIGSAVPSNAIRLHLFCTRWQLNREDSLVPSDKYPNGPYFLQDSYPPDTDTIEDYTPNKKLLTSVEGLGIPVDNGIPNYFGGGQFSPKHIDAHKGGVLFGGYTINRPTFDFTSETISNGDTTHSDFELMFAYEYTDNSIGAWEDSYQGSPITFEEGAEIFLKPENALVSAIHIYARDTSNDPATYRKIKRVTSSDAEYFGLPLVLKAPSEYSEEELPTGSADNEKVSLNHYLAYGTPSQLIPITSQKPNESGKAIEGISILRVDDDRLSSIRYQLAVFTDGYPELCFFDVREQEGDLLFQTDFQPFGLYCGLKSPESVFKYQRSVLFQGYKGIYELRSDGVSLAISNERYPELVNGIRSVTNHPVENEAWFLLENNECMVLDLDNDISPPVFKMIFPDEDSSRVMRSLSVLGDNVLCSADTIVLRLDDPSLLVDKDFESDDTEYDVQGIITSDHLSSFMQQMDLDVIEIIGNNYECQVEVDLQDARYDESNEDWQADFKSSIATGFYDLSMSGTVFDLSYRGIAPRLRLTLRKNESGRLAGAELYYQAVRGNRRET